MSWRFIHFGGRPAFFPCGSSGATAPTVRRSAPSSPALLRRPRHFHAGVTVVAVDHSLAPQDERRQVLLVRHQPVDHVSNEPGNEEDAENEKDVDRDHKHADSLVSGHSLTVIVSYGRLMPDHVPTARDRILDAAASTMKDRGLARATTKEIAAAAGYSEAMIYKLFDDKVDLFLSVLRERVPAVDILTRTDRTPGDANTLSGRLTATIEQITEFYRQTFAIGASLFSDANLLQRHRNAVMSQGAGPALLPAAVAQFLELEQRNDAIVAGAPINGVASSIAGACYLRAFLEQFYGPDHPQEPMPEFAASIIAAVLPSLTIPRQS